MGIELNWEFILIKIAFVAFLQCPQLTDLWFSSLKFYTHNLGGWRKRRKGLGHINVDPSLVEGASGAEED